MLITLGGLSWGKVRPLASPLLLMLSSGRPLSAGIAGTLSSVGVWVRWGLSWRVFIAGLAMCAVTMFGFVVNDLLDFDKDVAAGVRRPIAMGLLSKRMALGYAVCLLVAGFCLSGTLGSGAAVVLVTAFALALYTFFAKRLPMLKGLYVGGLCLTPMWYAASVTRGSLSTAAYVIVAFFIFGRETLMDANELAADGQAGMRTVAAALGPFWARSFGTGAMLVTLVCLSLVVRGRVGWGAAIFSVLSLLVIFGWPRISEGRRIALSRLPMFGAAVALATAWK
jgi:4-hydroxybenzoate polyprenyltransferase